MPTYVIERSFAEQLDLTGDDVKLIEAANADEGVRWLFSFLSADRRRSYCLYEAPSADAVLAQGLQSPISVENLTMEEEAYRRKGIAAEVCLTGEIEGRIIFDVDPGPAVQLASRLAGIAVSETDEDLVREAVCELANQIIGNAVTSSRRGRLPRFIDAVSTPSVPPSSRSSESAP